MMEGLVYIHVPKIGKERAIVVVVEKFQEFCIYLWRLLAPPGGMVTYFPKYSTQGSAVSRAAQQVLEYVDIKPQETFAQVFRRDPGGVSRKSAGDISSFAEK